MTRIVIKELVFDSWNRNHIQKHNVTIEEIVKAGHNLIYHKQSYQQRYVAIGRCGPRLLSLVIKRVSVGKYYLITARDASKKERKKVYEKEQENYSCF